MKILRFDGLSKEARRIGLSLRLQGIGPQRAVRIQLPLKVRLPRSKFYIPLFLLNNHIPTFDPKLGTSLLYEDRPLRHSRARSVSRFPSIVGTRGAETSTRFLSLFQRRRRRRRETH